MPNGLIGLAIAELETARGLIDAMAVRRPSDFTAANPWSISPAIRQRRAFGYKRRMAEVELADLRPIKIHLSVAGTPWERPDVAVTPER